MTTGQSPANKRDTMDVFQKGFHGEFIGQTSLLMLVLNRNTRTNIALAGEVPSPTLLGCLPSHISLLLKLKGEKSFPSFKRCPMILFSAASDELA